MIDDNTCPCGRPAAECVLPHCPGEPTEVGMNEGYLEMMQAHIDDDGKLSHLNGLDLLKEVYRLRRLLRRTTSSLTSNQRQPQSPKEQTK